MPTGLLPTKKHKRLLGTGKWLDINGEAIYSTRPWKIYGEGPTESASGSFSDQKKPYTAKDIRFTVKGETLYAIAMGQPIENTMINALGSKSSQWHDSQH